MPGVKNKSGRKRKKSNKVVEFIPGIPQPPKGLPSAIKKHFVAITKVMGMQEDQQFVAEVDVFAIVDYATIRARMESLREEMLDDDSLIPKWATLDRAASSWATKLFLTPLSRIDKTPNAVNSKNAVQALQGMFGE